MANAKPKEPQQWLQTVMVVGFSDGDPLHICLFDMSEPLPNLTVYKNGSFKCGACGVKGKWK